MLKELVGKEVVIVMGVSASKMSGFADNLKGKILQIDDSWLKLAQKKEQKESVYISIGHIKRIIPE